MPEKPPYVNRVVAFVDILGSASLIPSLSADPVLHNSFYQALSHIKYCSELSGNENTSYSDLEVSTFSDSIVISSEEQNIVSVIYACGWLQAELFKLEILTRGGISAGLTVHKDGILYGEALIKSHELESKCANYPRILIDPTLADTVSKNIKTFFLAEDVDGLWFVDPFKFDAFTNIGDDAIADGYDPREIYFSELNRCIEKKIKEAKEAKIVAKLTWLQKRSQAASQEYLKTRQSNISKIMSLRKK